MIKTIFIILLSLWVIDGCSYTSTPKLSVANATKEIDSLTVEFLRDKKNKNYKKAILSLKKISKINSNHDGKLIYGADIDYYLAELYLQTKEYSKAIEYYQKSANAYKTEKNRQDAYTIAISWLARLYMKDKKFKKSLIYHKEVIDRYKKSTKKDKNLQLSRSYGNIAILYQETGQFQKALEFNKKSLKLLLEFYPNNSFEISTNYNNISAIKDATGDYPMALKYLRKSLEINQKLFGEKNPILVSGFNNLAIHYIKIGEYQKGLLYLNNALEARGKNREDDEQLALIYSTMGELYNRMKESSKALSYHTKAIDIYKKLNRENSLDIASAYIHLGKYYLDKNQFDKAMNYYKKSQKIEENILGKDNLIVAETYSAIALCYMAKRDNQKAIEFFNKTLKIQKRFLGEDNLLTIETQQSIGAVEHNKKDYKKSYQKIKLSFDSFMRTRKDFLLVLNSQDKSSYIKETEDKIQLLLESASELRDKDIALVTLNDWINYKGSLFDRENAILRLQKSGDKETQKKLNKMLSQKTKLAKLYQSQPTKAKQQTWLNSIRKLEKEIAKIEIELETKTTEGLSKISYKDISKNLKKDELYIDYAKVGKRYFVFTLDKEKNISFKRYSIEDSQNISRLVLEFRRDTKRGKDVKKILSTLYDILMKDIDLNYKSLIVSSDGLLRLLPFETLYNQRDKHYLVEHKEIRYIPSAKELIRLYSKASQTAKNSVVIFANPDFDATVVAQNRGLRNEAIFRMKFGNLPQTKIEAEEIKKILRNRNIIEYQGREANEPNLLHLKQPKILHIATHGFFLNSNLFNPMLNSGLALSGANKSIKEGRDDGVVTALKLSQLNLQGTELVVLSACETGVTDIDSTESISGLSKAFIQAGAKNIVVSLWSVSDKGTKEFMALFYQAITDGNSYVKALKLTKTKMIKDGVSPFIWASFIING